MISIFLASLALLAADADPEVLPPPPTEAEMLAVLRDKRPDARLIDHQTSSLVGGRLKICGTAEIAGQVEPFALIAEEDSRMSASVTLAGQQPPATRPGLRPRRWKVQVHTPGNWNFIEGSRSDPRVQGLDAHARQLALQVCPALRPPTGVTWRTRVTLD